MAIAGIETATVHRDPAGQCVPPENPETSPSDEITRGAMTATFVDYGQQTVSLPIDLTYSIDLRVTADGRDLSIESQKVTALEDGDLEVVLRIHGVASELQRLADAVFEVAAVEVRAQQASTSVNAPEHEG